MVVESPPGPMTSLALGSWLGFPLGEWALSTIRALLALSKYESHYFTLRIFMLCRSLL